jgi:hypothetical protein
MSHPLLLAGAMLRRRSRVFLLAGLVMVFMAVMTAGASATIEVQNYNDPAGDPATFTYQLFGADATTQLASDTLGDGAKSSFGPDPSRYGNAYTVHAVLPAGWHTVDIQCMSSPGTATFTPDLARGSVTIQGHDTGEDHYCAFTNSNGPASGAGGGGGTGGGGSTGAGGAAGSATGVSPTLPAGRLSNSTSKAPRLLRFRGRTHYALARVFIGRTSVIKAQLRKGKQVVGSKRVKHSKAGTYDIKVNLSKTWLRRYRQRGLKRITLTLRIAVVGANGATKVYGPRTIVRI